MYVNISNEDILMNDSLGFFLGVPVTKEQCVGVVDGSNKKFEVANGPIYPRNGMGILPTLADLEVYTRKSAGSPSVTTDTLITPSKINAIPDDIMGIDVFKEIELTTAPATLDVDNVRASYVEELEPFVMQDITPSVKQKTKDVERMNSTDTMTGYGSMKISIKSEQVMTEQTIQYIRKLMYAPYDGNLDPVTGYNAHTMRPKPLNLYGYINMSYEDVLGRLYLENVKVTPDLPGGKAGDNSKITIEVTTPKLPRLILPDPV